MYSDHHLNVSFSGFLGVVQLFLIFPLVLLLRFPLEGVGVVIFGFFV